MVFSVSSSFFPHTFYLRDITFGEGSSLGLSLPFLQLPPMSPLFSLSCFLSHFICHSQSSVLLCLPAHCLSLSVCLSFCPWAERWRITHIETTANTNMPPLKPTLHTHKHTPMRTRNWPPWGQTQFKVKLCAAREMFPSNIMTEIDPSAARCSDEACDCVDNKLRVNTAMQRCGDSLIWASCDWYISYMFSFLWANLSQVLAVSPERPMVQQTGTVKDTVSSPTPYSPTNMYKITHIPSPCITPCIIKKCTHIYEKYTIWIVTHAPAFQS